MMGWRKKEAGVWRAVTRRRVSFSVACVRYYMPTYYLRCAVILVAAPPLPDPKKGGAENGLLEEQGHAHDAEPGQ